MERHYNFLVYISRAEDVPGLWLAHCLQLNIVSQGRSPAEARDALEEAVNLAIVDDLNNGLDPLGREPAGEDAWRPLNELLATGRRVDLSKVSRDGIENERPVSRFVLVMELSFHSTGHQPGEGRFPLSYAPQPEAAA